jgi:hypothetical protein
VRFLAFGIQTRIIRQTTVVVVVISGRGHDGGRDSGGGEDGMVRRSLV